MDVYACDHTKELIIKAHNNDKSAREKLVIDNSGLVWSIVKRFTGRGAEMEDLYKPVGIFGKYEQLILNFTEKIDPTAIKVFGQDLAGDRAIEITERLIIEGNRIIVPGNLVETVGLMDATIGDESLPGMVLQVFKK